MTTFQAASNEVSLAADLPRPDAAPTSVQPAGAPIPAVADSGRITFGASCRIPLALPRPTPAVTDSGRINFGASCRIPLQK